MRVSHQMPMAGTLLTIRGQEALVADGDSLHLWDLRDPELPMEERSFALPIAPKAILRTQDAVLLSASGSGGGIYAFGLGQSSQLEDRGFVPAVEVSFQKIELGALANGCFIAIAEDSLHILELASGDSLRRRASLELPGRMALWNIDGDRIVGGYTAGIVLIDASNPGAPRLETTIPVWTSGRAGALHGDWLYMVDKQVLRVISIADLAHPQELVSLSVLEEPYTVYTATMRFLGEHLFIMARGLGGWSPGFMLALDVSDPLHPQRSGYLDLQCLLSGIGFEESRPYGYALSADSKVFKTIDLSRIENIKYTASYAAPWSLSKLRLARQGQRAIASLKDAGLQVLDRQTDGSWSDAITVSTYPSKVANFVCDGRYVYASAYQIPDPCCGIDEWLFVYDLEQRRSLGDLSRSINPFFGGVPNHTARDGNQVVVSLPGDVSYCFDHLPGQEPRIVAETGQLNVFPVKGAWYVLGAAQLNVLEPTDWSSYYLISGMAVQFPLGGSTWMVRSGNYLYVLGDSGIVVLDLTDPQLPVVINSVTVPYAAGTDAAIAGELLVVPSDELGISLYDLSDPTTPSWIGIAPAFHKASGMAIGPNSILVSDPDAGLLEYPFPCGLDIEVPVFEPFTGLRVSSIDGGLRVSWSLLGSLSWDSFEILQRSEPGPTQTVATVPFITIGAQSTDITLPLDRRAGYYSVLGYAKGIKYQSNEVRFDPPPMPSLLLRGAVPNPFNPSTEIVYYQSSASEAVLRIYDTRGRLIWQYEDFASEGWHRVRWNGSDTSGRAVASGSYRVVLEAQRKRLSKSIMLIR